MRERTPTRASDASRPLHATDAVPRAMRVAALDSARRIPKAQLSCNPQLAGRRSSAARSFAGANA